MVTEGDARAFAWLVAETVIERLPVYVSGAPVEELVCQEDWLAEAESSAMPPELQRDSTDPDNTMNIIAGSSTQNGDAHADPAVAGVRSGQHSAGFDDGVLRAGWDAVHCDPRCE
jgi:hypothetical protein